MTYILCGLVPWGEALERREEALAALRCLAVLTAGDGPDDAKELFPGGDDFGQGGVRRFARKILLAGKEPCESAPD